MDLLLHLFRAPGGEPPCSMQTALAFGSGALLDAVVVRTVPVPALVGIAGRADWWPQHERVLKAAPSYGDR